MASRFLGHCYQMRLRQQEYAIYCYDNITSGSGSDNSFCHRTTCSSKATTTWSKNSSVTTGATTGWIAIKIAMVWTECDTAAAAVINSTTDCIKIIEINIELALISFCEWCVLI